MAGRRSCVNSLWSGTERVRIGERIKATLAGVLELQALRYKHLEMVDAALEDRGSAATNAVDSRAVEEESGTPESAVKHGSATPRRQQAPSPSDMVTLPIQSSPDDCGTNSGDGTSQSSSNKGNNSRWSTLSWDVPSDLLSPPTPDPSGTVPLDSDSRPSSGFYSVSGSSLSDSSYSVSSDAALGGVAQLGRAPKMWDRVLLSADNSDILWSEVAVQQQPAMQSKQGDGEPTQGRPVSAQSDLEGTGLSFLSDLCPGVGDSFVSSLLPILDPSHTSCPSSVHPKLQMDPHYCTDLVSRRTKEVYPYPSPLHAVALQSPLFAALSQEQSASPSPEGPQAYEIQESSDTTTLPHRSQQPPSVTHLEQYISRLARQYHSRIISSTSDLTVGATSVPAMHRGICNQGKSHGSTQSLSAFENRNMLSITPCKSLLGNSARVCLSTTGKKATRNSINLGNLPSATGEDLNINLHLNLNLNLTPGSHSSQSLADNPKNENFILKTDITAASATSLSSNTPTPALRTRPRISTCPNNLSHRSSLEVTSGCGPSPGFGSSAFSQSLDWSNSAPTETGPTLFTTNSGSAPGSQRSSLIKESSSSAKINEDSPVVGEISRLSGLSRAVVVGLMEQGVELDIDCFQTDITSEVKGHSKSHLTTPTDKSHDYTKLTDLNPQRPIQLSLSVTHSPQSQSSLTPPLSLSSSPMHPYQAIHIPSPHYSSHCNYQQVPSPSDLPSSTASSPASHPNQRNHSPPRPLRPSPLGSTPLSVFRRDAPFQCSLPRTNTRSFPLDHGGIQPRGGSLRQSGDVSGGWKRAEGEGLYRGKHASRKLIRAATVSSYAKRDNYSSIWGGEEEERSAAQSPKQTSNKLWRGLEGRLWGKESESDREEMDRAEYGYGWRRNSIGSWRREHQRWKASSSVNDKRTKTENSPMFSKKRGKEEGERHSSSLRLSRKALFRSESQGLLVPRNHSEEPTHRSHWVSSLDVAQGSLYVSKEEGVRLLSTKGGAKCLSSTASLFNISCSQSLEGSCLSLSPLSSPSFSPSPPPRTSLQRSRSLKDLGRKVFGSMRSLSLKRRSSKK